jgi:hypothetical protein
VGSALRHGPEPDDNERASEGAAAGVPTRLKVEAVTFQPTFVHEVLSKTRLPASALADTGSVALVAP